MISGDGLVTEQVFRVHALACELRNGNLKSLLQNSNKCNFARLRRRRSPIPAQGFLPWDKQPKHHRTTLKELRRWLKERQEVLTPIMAEQNKLTKEEAGERMRSFSA